jgi:hypothetical protein
MCPCHFKTTGFLTDDTAQTTFLVLRCKENNHSISSLTHIYAQQEGHWSQNGGQRRLGGGSGANENRSQAKILRPGLKT